MRRLGHLNNNQYANSLAGKCILEFGVTCQENKMNFRTFYKTVKESAQIDIAPTILSILNVSYRLVQSSIRKLRGLNPILKQVMQQRPV